MITSNTARFPLNATFELTARCNLQCKMCLIRVDHKRMAELGGRERTAEEWIQMAQEIKDAGALGLLLTGGEPMLRSDFPKIYKEIAQMGFVLTLYTNATLVSPEIMELLHAYPPHNIGVTVYGSSSETYEKVTGQGWAYERMLEGVKLLKELPSKLSIRTTIIKDNFEDLDHIIEMALSLGEDVDFNVTRIVTKQVRGGLADVEACRLTPEQNVWIQERIRNDYTISPLKNYFEQAKMEEVNMLKLANQSKDTISEIRKKRSTLYGCSAGMDSFTITWDGKLIGCQLLGDCWTEPFAVGFNKAWELFPSTVKLPEVSEQCKNCSTACCACPATRLAETGSLGGCPDYICQEGKLREEMYDRLLNQLNQIINIDNCETLKFS